MIMGSPIDLRPYPIFVAREIMDFPAAALRVVIGEEDACSFYTKVAIIEKKPTTTSNELEALIAELRRSLSP